MKNIEKYTNTKDALEAYNQPKSKIVPFEEWLECEFEEPREQTLLEAASEVMRTWESQWQYGHLSIIEKAVRKLSIAIEREKRKPVRNCDIGNALEQVSRHRIWCKCGGACAVSCKMCFAKWSQMPYEAGGAE